MEAAPYEVDLESLEADLINIKDMTYIEDMHVWSINTGKLALS